MEMGGSPGPPEAEKSTGLSWRGDLESSKGPKGVALAVGVETRGVLWARIGERSLMETRAPLWVLLGIEGPRKLIPGGPTG